MDKAAALEAVFTETGISGVQAGAIGDDILDLGVLARCRLAVGVADACPEVRAAAHLVTAAGGGRGAVREVIEQILQAQGLWLPIVEQFRAGSRL
jgi:3-deoxy-D-manno-octulosonate 8-phosphate phosphatase (KDO 8-P phosphatase)